MRFIIPSLAAILVALTISACSSSSNSSASSTASSDNGGAMTAASTEPVASTAAMGGSSLPSYPGATTEASGSSMGGTASGTVLQTADSFDKVYAWYQQNMPAGSEKAHTTTPVQTAVFTVGEAGKDQQSVSITVAGDKTMITIAHVKQ